MDRTPKDLVVWAATLAGRTRFCAVDRVQELGQLLNRACIEAERTHEEEGRWKLFRIESVLESLTDALQSVKDADWRSTPRRKDAIPVFSAMADTPRPYPVRAEAAAELRQIVHQAA